MAHDTHDTAREALRALLAEHLTEDPEAIGRTHTASAAHAVVWRDGEVVFDEAMGLAQLVPAPRALADAPVFDLASVTKAMVTATLAMQAVDEGLVTWDTPVSAVLPGWDEAPGEPDGATLLHLLNHSSGLPAWYRYYHEYPMEPPVAALPAQRRAIMDRVLRTPRDCAPGTRHLYSDLGYIILCDLLETLFHARLSTLAEQRIFAPLGLTHTRYVDRMRGDAPIHDAVSTERDPLRGRVVTGEVHDENTYILGGVSGHAGAFSTARDLARFGAHLAALDAGTTRQEGIVRRETLRFCWSEAARGASGHHLGGWDTPSGAASSAGAVFARTHTVGHLGFTGTSLWIERAHEGVSPTVVVLLTNRVHPHRDPGRAHPLRVAFHTRVGALVREGAL